MRRVDGESYIAVSVAALGDQEVTESGTRFVMTLDQAKVLRRTLGIEIELAEAERESNPLKRS